jgi:hypothetical protein
VRCASGLAVVVLVLSGCDPSERDCVESWNAHAGAHAAAVRDAGYRRATFATWRDGGSDTGRSQCVAMFRVSEGRPWSIFVTRGKRRSWSEDVGGDAYGRDGPTGEPGVEVAVRADGRITSP